MHEMKEEHYEEMNETKKSDRLKNIGISTFSADLMSDFLDK